MRSTTLGLCPLLSLPFVFGCAAPAVELDPIQLTARHTVDYHAEVISGPSNLVDAIVHGTDEVETDRVFAIRCRLVPVEEAEARELGLLGVGAWTIDVKEANARLGTEAWEPRVRETLLMVYKGQVASTSVLNQRAYIRSFELTAADNALMADPIVDVLDEGTLLLASVEGREEDRVELGLTLRLSDLQELDEVEANVPGGFTPVTIQRPVVSQQRLATEVTLSEEECLLLVALAPDGAGRFIAFVDVREHVQQD